MALVAGIIGLPNVGKSTLFNAITNSAVEAANYPFATIEPNVGVVSVPDERLERLAAIVQPLKTTPATFKFTDIAGLVRGASKGEGLGNQFLASIREVDAVCHVVRCFEDESVIHVEKTVDALRDVQIVDFELLLSDAEIVSKRKQRIAKKAQAGDAEAVVELRACDFLLASFDKALRPDMSALTDQQRALVAPYNLISAKPVIYVANVAERELSAPDANPHFVALWAHARATGAQVVCVSAQIESEIARLPKSEQAAFMADAGIKESGIAALSRAAYDILGLRTFFTFGKTEVKAWTFRAGMTAPQCAGVIHTDFERGFIKAEVVDWAELADAGSEAVARERGAMRTEGREYAVRDGDVCHFRFNVTK